jgi:uncharacterized protein YggL (DUF469 family)
MFSRLADYTASVAAASIGGGGLDRRQYVVANEGSQATENDRAVTHAWLASRPELRAWQVGELEDLEQDA